MAVTQAPAGLRGVWEQQLELLREASVPCCGAVADLLPPMVLVRPPDVAFTFGYGIDYTFTGLVIAANVGTAEALDQLSDLLISAQAALGGVLTAGFRTDVPGIDGADPAPAYAITWQVSHRYATTRRTRT